MGIRKKDTGGATVLIIFIGFLMFVLVLAGIGLQMKIATAQRTRNISRAESTLKDSVKAAVDSPLPQAVNIDGSLIQDTITQIFAQKMAIPNGNVVVRNFVVYTDADAGSPAPPGITGTIPGKSIYLDVLVTWTTYPVWGKTYTGTYPVQVLVATPTYNASGQQWE